MERDKKASIIIEDRSEYVQIGKTGETENVVIAKDMYRKLLKQIESVELR